MKRKLKDEQIKKRISSYKEELVEMDFRDLFLDNNWIDFSGSDGVTVITTDGIGECASLNMIEVIVQ
jgi:hypothetical protein